jgi:lipopolysaccharide transport system ATP-binding protein
MISPAIKIEELGKTFRVWRHPSDMLREVVTGRRHHREFQALRNISLEVPPGAIVGVMGRNGAGKSTLLRIVAGTLDATTGSVAVNGRIAAILELGTGFHPEYSGRENIMLGGMCLGLAREEIISREDEIIEFSELREFIDQPFRTYSSGMQARLTFAVATSVDPDILIIDEALAVGDARFQVKSLDRIRNFKWRGKAILLVSHDINAITAICDEAVLLERGAVHTKGAPGVVGNVYHELLFGTRMALSPSLPVQADKRTASERTIVGVPTPPSIVAATPANAAAGDTRMPAAVEPAPSRSVTEGMVVPDAMTRAADHVDGDSKGNQTCTAMRDGTLPVQENGANGSGGSLSPREHRYGNGAAQIVSIQIQDCDGRSVTRLNSLETYTIVCRVQALQEIKEVVFGFLVRNVRGMDIFGWDSRCGGIEVSSPALKSPTLRAKDAFEARVEFRNNLAGGTYFLTVGLARPDTEKLDMWLDALEFQVEPTINIFAASLVNLELRPGGRSQDTKVRTLWSLIN